LAERQSKKCVAVKIGVFSANNLDFRFSNVDTRGKRVQGEDIEKSLKKIAKSGGNLRQLVGGVKKRFFCPLFFVVACLNERKYISSLQEAGRLCVVELAKRLVFWKDVIFTKENKACKEPNRINERR